MAVFAEDEEGAEVRTAHEGVAGEDQGDEAERPAFERTSGGATAFDEGSESARRMSSTSHSDAVSLRALSRNNNLD